MIPRITCISRSRKSIQTVLGRNFSTTFYRLNENSLKRLSDIIDNTEQNADLKNDVIETLKETEEKSKAPKPLILTSRKTGVIKKFSRDLEKYRPPKVVLKKGSRKKTNDDDDDHTKPKRAHDTFEVNLYESMYESDRSKLLVFEKTASTNQIIESIDELRPFTNANNTTFSPLEIQVLANKLTQLYKKQDLFDYVQVNTPYGTKISRSKKKSFYVQKILEDVWNIKVDVNKKVGALTNQSEDANEMIITKRFKVDAKLVFFLFANNGNLLFNYTSNGIRIRFPKSDYIVVSAIQSKMEWFEISLNLTLSNLKKHLIDFSGINQMFKNHDNILPGENFEALPVQYIQKMSDVYFNKVRDNVYVLNGDSQRALVKARRLLVWYLNYNSHIIHKFANVNELMASDDLVKFYPFTDTISVPWIYRNQNWYRLKSPRAKLLPKQVDPVELNEGNEANSDGEVEAEVEETKTMSEESTESNDTDKPGIECAIPLTDQQIDHIYEKLCDFTLANKESTGMPIFTWDHPVFTATFGQILFGENVKQKLSASENSEVFNIDNLVSGPSKPFIFHPSFPVGKKEVLTLPLFNEPDSLSPNALEDVDYHSYFVHVRLVPNPYVNLHPGGKGGSFFETDPSHYKIYPPIELFMEMNEKDKVQWDTLKVVTVERESNVLVNLPNKISDIKFSSAVTSTLVDAYADNEYDIIDDIREEDIENDDPAIDNQTSVLKSENDRFKLNKDAKRIPQFLKKQPALFKFLNESKFTLLLESSKIRVNENVDIELKTEDGKTKTVNYLYESLTYRKTLDFKFNNDYLLQLTTAEGGLVGGRRTEISLHNIKANQMDGESGQLEEENVSDDNRNLNKEDFKQFLKQAIAFVEYASK